MAELYGKGTGLVKGKGGSMHLFDVKNDLMGGYGIVGGHIPLGVGMAYSLRYQGTDGIVQLYFGDGAIHNGAFHEAREPGRALGQGRHEPLPLHPREQPLRHGHQRRARHRQDRPRQPSSTPTGSSTRRSTAWISTRSWAMPTGPSNRVRETGKPYALEMMTYRIAPHGAADFLERYRSKDEVKEARKRDPINLYEHKLIESGAATEEQLEEIRAAEQAIDRGCRQVRRREPGAGSGRALHGRLVHPKSAS